MPGTAPVATAAAAAAAADQQRVREPVDGLERFKSVKVVRAGEITEVVAAGCYVKEIDGGSVLRLFEPKMTERYMPVVGDFWIVYPDGYQSLCPKGAFEDGYVSIAD